MKIKKECCQHCLKCYPKRWQKIEEVLPDLKYTGTGVIVLWTCLLLPIIAPLVYLWYYYCERIQLNDKKQR